MSNALKEIKAKRNTHEDDMLTVYADNIDDLNAVLVQYDAANVLHASDAMETETEMRFLDAIKVGREAVGNGLDVAVDEHDGKGLLHIADYS